MSIAKIFLVSGSANFSTRDVWDGYRIGLELTGMTVVPYPTFSFLKVLSPESVCSDIIGRAVDVENNFDMVVFVDGLFFRRDRARVPRSIQRAGIPTALIATDDPYENLKSVESYFTHRFTNEIRCVQKGVIYLPTATPLLPQLPPVNNPAFDISFLGTVFEDRVPLLLEIAKYCEQTQRRFLIAGNIISGVEEFKKMSSTELRLRTIDTSEKWEIYAQSRLTINLFRESKSPADSPSPRVFEVTALGHAALLTGPDRAEVRKCFGDSVYHFQDADSAISMIEQALGDEADRRSRVERARIITHNEHLYEHRALTLISELTKAESQRENQQATEEQIVWIIGCGRTGSTWLNELLGSLPGIRRWHEPYFGRFFKHLHDRPDEFQRSASFFSEEHKKVWLSGIRDLFFKMVYERYPQFGRHALSIKEVNTPELYGWLRSLFPAGRVIFLVRDPFDTLDSYIDLQKPESWNERFADSLPANPENRIRHAAELIRDSMTAAMDAYEMHPENQRLLISYEDLLIDPAPHLKACSELIGEPVDQTTIEAAVEKHQFKNHKKTGTLQFRRYGKSGVWQQSENFTPEVLRIANEVLGPLRRRFGYHNP